MMNRFQLLSLMALVCAPAAVAGCAVLAVMMRRARRAAAKSESFASGIAERLALVERKLEAAAQYSAEQSRRLAWLESRVRQGRVVGVPAAGSNPADASRPSMTERRHRVLSLARRGVDVESIAETLGVPYGEVELIISLSAAA